jgi:hypothetical protein
MENGFHASPPDVSACILARNRAACMHELDADNYFLFAQCSIACLGYAFAQMKNGCAQHCFKGASRMLSGLQDSTRILGKEPDNDFRLKNIFEERKREAATDADPSFRLNLLFFNLIYASHMQSQLRSACSIDLTFRCSSQR